MRNTGKPHTIGRFDDDDDQVLFFSASNPDSAPPQFDEMRRLPELQQPSRHLTDGYGAGQTELISQYYDSAEGRYEFSGNQDIDAVLIGSRWTVTNLTYSFPTSGSFYTDGTDSYFGNEAAGHVTFNSQQQAATRYALAQVGAYTNLSFTEITETATTHANLRLSQTTDPKVGSAYGNFPSSSNRAGDIWFGMTDQPFYDTPAAGNWGQATILHELGHTLGLKHGHDDYTTSDLVGYIDAPSGGGSRYGSAALPSDHDGQDWSLMTYRSDPANGISFEGEGFNQPQTYMQDDIAALQYLYGADFSTNSGNTTYTWNVTTGEQSVDGVGLGAPTGNVILRTIWDGNGTDTYDLSNYTTSLDVDLNAGAFSTFSTLQLANHRANSGGTALAEGNIANALLYNGDTRSLIENATGGTGSDTLRGNQASNTLIGNDGSDTLIGDIGNDTLLGGNQADNLYGDGIPGTPTGVGMGTGSVTKVAGAGNVDIANAIDVTNTFSLASNPNIIDSTTTPHVTISGTGDDNRDYYKIVVNSGTTLTLDIDNTSGIDSFIRLLDASGNEIAYDDDSLTSDGAGGSTSGFDSFLVYTISETGTYYIEVGDYLTSSTNEPIAAGATYDLQISAIGGLPVGSGAGNDNLNGGTGADMMYGGDGSDLYYVDSADDRVIELANAGTDRVLTNTSYTLGAGQSIELFTTWNDSTTFAVNLTGNALAQTIKGNMGANSLIGGGGTDILQGLGGNDLYYVDSADDRVIEVANAGADRVLTNTGYTLGAGQSIELFTTWNDSTTFAVNLTGNELAQTIKGNMGANVINGGGGTDTLQGLGGNDLYYVDSADDRVIELANAGADRVLTNTSYTLGAGQSIELFTTWNDSTTFAVNLTGNELAQTIKGNMGANVINGGLGNDTLTGLGGADTFAFKTALGSGNVDHITDFVASTSSTHDIIHLSRGVFTNLVVGNLTEAAFKDVTAGPSTIDASDRILYNHTTGALSYDADGSGTTSTAVQFAILDNKAALSHLDFLVIA